MLNKRIKILIIDDSDEICGFLKRMLDKYGFLVYTSSDGLEGIQKAIELKPDLIFLDLMMPTFDGIKMLQVKKVLKEIEDIPVIIISANTAKRNVIAALEAGAEKVLSKPLKEQKIIENISELMGIKLSEGKKNDLPFSTHEKEELQDEMVSIFLRSFPDKKRKITEAIRKKEVETLKTILHEFSGAGGTMGYDEITRLSKEIEEKEFESPTDWIFAEYKCNQIFQKIQNIRSEFQKQI